MSLVHPQPALPLRISTQFSTAVLGLPGLSPVCRQIKYHVLFKVCANFLKTVIHRLSIESTDHAAKVGGGVKCASIS